MFKLGFIFIVSLNMMACQSLKKYEPPKQDRSRLSVEVVYDNHLLYQDSLSLFISKYDTPCTLQFLGYVDLENNVTNYVELPSGTPLLIEVVRSSLSFAGKSQDPRASYIKLKTQDSTEYKITFNERRGVMHGSLFKSPSGQNQWSIPEPDIGTICTN